MPQRDQIIAWLKDVHAVEQNLTNVLQQHIRVAQDMPEMLEQMQRHLEETRRHSERVRLALASLGAEPSTVKSVAGGLMGAMEGMSTGLFRDELIKNAIADYAMEHFEMACYSALAAAAEGAGLSDIARTCREIFGEEAEMADWLEERIPALTRLHLLQQAPTAS